MRSASIIMEFAGGNPTMRMGGMVGVFESNIESATIGMDNERASDSSQGCGSGC
jgi:hypothetical protein